jgi:RsiW-degrading membrane proteinase PrsW (M82 family)
MTWGQPQPYAAGASVARPARGGRSALRRWLLTAFVVIGFLLAALVLAVYYDATLGVLTTLLAVMLAVLPLGIVIPTFLWLDRFEAEPTRYLVVAFLWGALVAALIGGVFNTGATIAFESAIGQPDQAMLATAIFSAPLVEEASKGLLVLLVWWLRRREFDGITDGMVYAGIVAAGFAFTENIQYLGLAYQHGGGQALTGTFVARCLFTPFAHPMFTVMTGIGIGIAASTRNRLLRVLAPVGGYLLAAMLHALWNLGAVTGGQGMVATYLVVEVPIFVGFLVLVAWVRRREGRLIGRYLSPYADAGWLAPGEVRMLSTMSGRRAARVWAKSQGGRRALRSMQAFQDTASELALLRLRMHHSAADAHALDTERALLEALAVRRQGFAGA